MAFRRNATCGWTEPRLSELSPEPMCLYSKNMQTSQSGSFYRINDCKLLYGPLNCQFSPISDMDWLDVLTPEAIAKTTRYVCTLYFTTLLCLTWPPIYQTLAVVLNVSKFYWNLSMIHCYPVNVWFSLDQHEQSNWCVSYTIFSRTNNMVYSCPILVNMHLRWWIRYRYDRKCLLDTFIEQSCLVY